MARSKAHDAADLPVAGLDNIFEDLGLPDAEGLEFKAALIEELCEAASASGLTTSTLAKALGVDNGDASRLLSRRASRFSIERLVRFALALGIDIDVRLCAGRGRKGELRIEAASKGRLPTDGAADISALESVVDLERSADKAEPSAPVVQSMICEIVEFAAYRKSKATYSVITKSDSELKRSVNG